jgi:hypothetical protein
MQRVGDALKAVGRFGEAARVYCKSAERHVQEKTEKNILYKTAGSAFTRSREFPLGEKAFVQALYFGDESNMHVGLGIQKIHEMPRRSMS